MADLRLKDSYVHGRSLGSPDEPNLFADRWSFRLLGINFEIYKNTVLALSTTAIGVLGIIAMNAASARPPLPDQDFIDGAVKVAKAVSELVAGFGGLLTAGLMYIHRQQYSAQN